MQRHSVVLVFLSFVVSVSISFAAESYLLNDLKYENKTLQIVTSGKVKYNVLKLSDPPRIVIELFNTEHNLATKEQKVSDDIIKRIRSGQFRDKPTKIARIVLDLLKMVDYEATQKDKTILVKLVTEAKAVEVEETPKPTTIKPEVEPAKVEAPVSQPAVEPPTKPVVLAPPVPAPVEKEPAVEPPKVEPPVSQPAVVPLTPPVVSVPPAVTPVVKKPVVKPIKKASVKPEKPKKEFVLPKTLVTLDYVDADIRDVLQVMAIRSGINIIYGPDVKDTITISLRNVPFDQAFNTILTLKGLTIVPVAENVIRVVTPAQLTLERAEGVTFTKVFPLNYARASEIKAQLDSVRAAEGRRGAIVVDERTNSLIVTETLEGLQLTEKLIAELDKKPQQVSIEAKLVDITLSDLFELGVDWSGRQIEVVRGGGATLKRGDVIAGPMRITQPDVPGVKEARGIGVETELPLVDKGGIFSFGLVTDNITLSAKLAALATAGRMKVLASPKITTLNNKEAKILIGEKVPYRTTTISPGPPPVVTEAWVYVDAGIKLTVTPIINPDRVITLKVKPEVSVPAKAPPGVAPGIKSREAEVTVMISDNDTLVIGGLIREEDIKDIRKIPLLGDLPILGYLFKYRKDTKERTELAIFLTPKIIE